MIPRLLLLACLVLPLGLTPRMEDWFQTWEGSRTGVNTLALLFGSSRRMFASQAFVKADAYFHSGYYPSMFDNQAAFATAHIAADSGAAEDRNKGDEHVFLGAPSDWVDRFGRRFYPSEHTHLGEAAGSDEHSIDEVREILPWLKLSVDLDPHFTDSYLVAAYWLRERLNRPAEAEQFLREGLRDNPDSYALFFELGRIQLEAHGDAERARTVWLAALKKWEKVEGGKPEPDRFFEAQILSYLATVEMALNHRDAAIDALRRAEDATDNRGLFRRRLDILTGGAAQ